MTGYAHVLLVIFTYVVRVICADSVGFNFTDSLNIDYDVSFSNYKESNSSNDITISLERQHFKISKKHFRIKFDGGISWNRSSWMNMIDDAGNIIDQYIDTPLAWRASRYRRKPSFVSSAFLQLNKFLKFISWPILEIKTQHGDNSQYLESVLPNRTSKDPVHLSGRHKRLSESEGSYSDEVEVDRSGGVIDEAIDDGSVIIDSPEVEEHELATYVYIPTSYMGCYRKTLPVSGRFSLLGVDTMSVDGCVYFCRDRRRTYAALHNGRNCICYSHLLQKDITSENECNKECLTNNQQICGGLHSISVFTTCNLYFYGFSCIQTCFCADGPCDFYTGICPSERCKENWKGVRCNKHAYLDVSLFMASWTGLIIYFFGCIFIIGFSWWTLVHMKILEAKI